MCVMCVGWLSLSFFKQKTAYEMRISDWSSDVCSSDLVGAALGLGAAGDALDQQVHRDLQLHRVVHRLADPAQQRVERVGLGQVARVAVEDEAAFRVVAREAVLEHAQQDLVGHQVATCHDFLRLPAQRARSDENTSELSSLMRK